MYYVVSKNTNVVYLIACPRLEEHEGRGLVEVQARVAVAIGQARAQHPVAGYGGHKSSKLTELHPTVHR